MIITRTPFRITLGGGGTDLPSYYSQYGGFVFSVTIDKYMYINLNTPIVDDLIRIKYSKYEECTSVDEIQHELAREALRLIEIKNSVEIQSMADIPAGTGLGSSGCYLVGLLNALHTYKSVNVSQQELAEEACFIEINVLKHPVGKQDQYTASFGGFVILNIDKNGTVKVERPPISEDIVDELESSLLVYYTHTSRSAINILKGQSKATQDKSSEKHKEVVDSLHAIKEIGYKTYEAIVSGNLDEFGRLMDVHWQTKKKLSGQISNSLIDDIYQIGKENGAIGGKVLGAGGGGFIIFYCPKKNQIELSSAMTKCRLRRMRFRFDFDGSKVMVNVFNRRQSLQREMRIASSTLSK